MKPIPTDPWKLQERIMGALIGDILDPRSKDFGRLDALRASMKATERPAVMIVKVRNA